MTRRNVGLVYLKEMRDTLRDRRTLFISIILPILLYPILMIGLSQVVVSAKRKIDAEIQTVAIKAEADDAELIEARLTGPVAEEDDAESEGDGEAKEAMGLEVVTVVDPAEAARNGDIDAWIELPPDFAETIEDGRQGTVTIHFDSTKEPSAAAHRKLLRVFSKYRTHVLRSRNLSEADIEPVKVKPADSASTEQRGAKQFGPMLALLLVIMALSGAFYPAVDIMAGEKERGTMETLLVCPATRTEIVVGKYLTVLTMTVVTALLNFASMAVTFSHFAGFVTKGSGSMSLTISPMVGFVIVVALLQIGRDTSELQSL